MTKGVKIAKITENDSQEQRISKLNSNFQNLLAASMRLDKLGILCNRNKKQTDEVAADAVAAQTAADSAQQSAKDAQTAANNAHIMADAAQSSANEAAAAASNAQTTADNAAKYAQEANEKAESAATDAAKANIDLSEVKTEVTNIKADSVTLRSDLEGQIETVTTTMETDYAKKTDLSDTEATLRTEISTSAAGITQTVSETYAKKTDVTDAIVTAKADLQTQITQNAESISLTSKSVEQTQVDIKENATNITEAKSAAATAQSTANAAKTDAAEAATAAANAQSAADEANTAASNAQTKANEAATAASTAKTAADKAKTDLATAQAKLAEVEANANATAEDLATAQQAVETAQAMADAAQDAANTAQANAATAKSTADTAKANAEAAQTTANIAKTNAENAKKAAEDAQASAKAANDALAVLEPRVTAAETAIEQNSEAITLRATKTEVTTAKSEAISTAAADATSKANAAQSEIVSMGEQLVINGSGLMGDNTNFRSLVFDASKANGSAGSFTREGTNYTFQVSDKFFPVNKDIRYSFELDATSSNGSALMYSFLDFYDIDKNRIHSSAHMYNPNTLTTLASDLNNGDTVVHLTSLDNWDVSTGSMIQKRGFIFWDYTNSFGYTYPEETYSRHFYQNIYEDENVNKSNNTITLNKAWSYGTVPAGTKLSQSDAGATYKYQGMNESKPPANEWRHYKGFYEGTDYTGRNIISKLPPGAAYAKVGFLWNYNRAEDKVWVTNISVKTDYDHAIDTAKADAATDATSKANAALADAKSYADAQIKVSADSITSSVASTYQTKDAMGNYSTTEQMNSAIEQKAGEITTSVSRTYQVKGDYATKTQAQGYANTAKTEAVSAAAADATSKANAAQANAISTAAEDATTKADAAEAAAKQDTANKLKDYSTTVQMNSAIQQKADSITSTVAETYQPKGDYVTGTSAYSQLKQTVSGINSTVQSHSGSISNLQQTADGIHIRLDKQQTVRNLVSKSRLLDGWGYVVSAGVTVSKNVSTSAPEFGEVTVARFNASTTNSSDQSSYIHMTNAARVTSGSKYTLSVWARKVSGGNARPRLSLSTTNQSAIITENLTTEWKRYSYTFTLGTISGSGKYVDITTSFGVSVLAGHTGVFEVCCPQLESGDTMNPWSASSTDSTDFMGFTKNGLVVGDMTDEKLGSNVCLNSGGVHVFHEGCEEGVNEIAHLGYGEGNAESGTDEAPYYTFGVRKSGSAVGNYSVVEGTDNTASAFCSHTEGYLATASGVNAHAEGSGTTASGGASHAEGGQTTASNNVAHAEGSMTVASGYASHAEGYETKATGEASHAEGRKSQASGLNSHASGLNTMASSDNQTAIGKYNVEDTEGKYAFIVGNGTSTARSNAFTVDWDGNVDLNPYGKSFKPYYVSGTTAVTRLFTAGYVTNSKTQVVFTIPIERYCTYRTVSITSDSGGAFKLRQDGNYTHGSGSSTLVNPSSYTATHRGKYITVVATFSNTTNAVNNAPVGIEFSGNLTFS